MITNQIKMRQTKIGLRSGMLAIAVAVLMFACGEGTDVVDSGTYPGTIDKVEADKEEIYVVTDDGARLELYFTDETVLVRNGEAVDFSVMEKGMQVEVEVERVGQRMDPIRVRIME